MTLLAAVAAGCSSAPPSSKAPPARHKSSASTTSVPLATTTTPTTAPAQSLQASSIQVQITGSSAEVQFASSDLSGSLQTADPGFSAGGTIFSFLVEGVSYSGAAVTTTSTSTSGLISQVVASADSNGVSVRVTLRSQATSYQLGLGHDLVGLTLTAN